MKKLIGLKQQTYNWLIALRKADER